MIHILPHQQKVGWGSTKYDSGVTQKHHLTKHKYNTTNGRVHISKMSENGVFQYTTPSPSPKYGNYTNHTITFPRQGLNLVCWCSVCQLPYDSRVEICKPFLFPIFWLSDWEYMCPNFQIFSVYAKKKKRSKLNLCPNFAGEGERLEHCPNFHVYFLFWWLP